MIKNIKIYRHGNDTRDWIVAWADTKKRIKEMSKRFPTEEEAIKKAEKLGLTKLSKNETLKQEAKEISMHPDDLGGISVVDLDDVFELIDKAIA